MKEMRPEEIRKFLSAGTRTGKVGVVRQDGRPHVTPIWFVLDGEDLVFTTWHESVKAACLERDPRICLCVDEETPLYAFVMVEGVVEISRDPDQLYEYARRIAARYMGPDRAEEYGRRNSAEGELLVRVKPTKIIGQKDMAA
jgi:PPOX class probable F420-dependent enzyme